MLQHRQLYEQEVVASGASAIIHKGASDLVVLAHMVHRLRHTLHTQEQLGSAHSSPFLTSVEEHHRRLHRIALYCPQQLRQMSGFSFVGFVSGQQRSLSSDVVDDIHDVDRKLLTELVHAPGLLSYSSFELRTGSWYNLVLLEDREAKRHIKGSHTHAHAAYQLAPRYYEWIRLHSGVIVGKLMSQCHLVLQRTKHYDFRAHSSSPLIHETVYSAQSTSVDVGAELAEQGLVQPIPQCS